MKVVGSNPYIIYWMDIFSHRCYVKNEMLVSKRRRDWPIKKFLEVPPKEKLINHVLVIIAIQMPFCVRITLWNRRRTGFIHPPNALVLQI